MRAPRPGSRWTSSRGRRRDRYADYMTSPAWYTHRDRWLTEQQHRTGAPPVCVVCGHPDIDLHHLGYQRLGHETYEDHLPMCRVHHNLFHAAWDANPHLRRLGRRAACLALVAQMRAASRASDRG